jgi:hypothetical protein
MYLNIPYGDIYTIGMFSIDSANAGYIQIIIWNIMLYDNTLLTNLTIIEIFWGFIF